MSWLERRRPRPQTFRTFAEKAERAAASFARFREAMLRIPVRQYCNEPVASEDEQPCGLDAGHAGACKVLYQVPLPATAAEWRAQGFTYIGSGK